jgi:hypothetical protein
MREYIFYRWRNGILEIAHLTFCRLQLLAQRYLKLLKSALFHENFDAQGLATAFSRE